MTNAVFKCAMRAVSELQDDGILLVEDGNHGEYRPRADEFGDGEYSFIRAADLDSGRVLVESAERINDKAVERIRKGVGQGGDILFSHKGRVESSPPLRSIRRPLSVRPRQRSGGHSIRIASIGDTFTASCGREHSQNSGWREAMRQTWPLMSASPRNGN